MTFHIYTIGKGWWLEGAAGFALRRALAGRFTQQEAESACREHSNWGPHENHPRVVMIPAE